MIEKSSTYAFRSCSAEDIVLLLLTVHVSQTIDLNLEILWDYLALSLLQNLLLIEKVTLEFK
jgi:hypothetical protein